jgi:hypothetical protein
MNPQIKQIVKDFQEKFKNYLLCYEVLSSEKVTEIRKYQVSGEEEVSYSDPSSLMGTITFRGGKYLIAPYGLDMGHFIAEKLQQLSDAKDKECAEKVRVAKLGVGDKDCTDCSDLKNYCVDCETEITNDIPQCSDCRSQL